MVELNLPSDVAPVRADEEMDWPRLEAWLVRNIPELEGNMDVAQFPGGHANLTYCVGFGELELVVRRPPHGTIAPGAHDMAREYRVLSGLAPVFDRAPRALAFCEDEYVIGAPFVVVERRRGVVLREKLPEALQAHEDVEARITRALMDAMIDLHQIDPKSAGLEKLGRADGFVERQLSGWAKRWSLVTEEKNVLFDEVHDRLVASMPASRYVSIVHNDYKFDNCMFDPDKPDRVDSIFDWDMATLGDPLVELGTLLGYWPQNGNGRSDFPTIALDMSAFPDRSELVKRYAAAGFDVSDVPWYEAFALWKLAVVLRQLFRRFELGQSKDDRFAKFEQSIPHLLELSRSSLSG